MLVTDRLLKCLQQYLIQEHPDEEVAKLRDSSAVKAAGVTQIVLDADDPEEHDGMHGVFMVPVELIVRLHPGDVSETARRDLLSGLMDTLGGLADLKTFVNDPEEARGIGAHGFYLYDLVIEDGGWQEEGEEYEGHVVMMATCMGMDRS